jgi:hypothetical protein
MFDRFGPRHCDDNPRDGHDTYALRWDDDPHDRDGGPARAGP